MTTIRLQVEGARELDAQFKTLADRLRRKYIKQAVRAVGSQIIRAARQNLRTNQSDRRRRTDEGKLTGLARSFQQRPSSKWPSAASVARRGIVGVSVGHRWPEGAHAHLVEFGHKMVTHWPGRREVGAVRGYPYFRPAMDAVRFKMPRIIANKVRQGLEREAKRRIK